MTTRFEQAFSAAALREMAGERSFERGADYAAEGRVRRLKVGDGEASGAVRGTETYHVRLWLEAGEPMFSCTCPVVADGRFCKHCVAVGLLATDPLTVTAATRRSSSDDPVRVYLEGLDNARLVEMLMAQAEDDELLQSRLEAQAATAKGRDLDVKTFRRLIRKTINPRGFIDYRSVYDYARGVDGIVDSLADLLVAGSAAQVVDLCEYALTCLEDALGNVDDSGGNLGDIKQRICDLHHEACLAARPDPVALARRLFEWAFNSDWETFLDAAAAYADVLGESGLAAYRREAERVWAQTPAVGPGEASRYSHRRFTITYIMETLAEVSGDVESLVAVKAHDLSSPYDFFEIAEIYRAADRHDEALAWAERGLDAYPDCVDDRLLEVLADEYEHRGRSDQAMLVMWGLLERRTGLDSYQRLKAHAVRSGEWGAWRPRALDHLRSAGDESAARVRPFAGSWRSARSTPQSTPPLLGSCDEALTAQINAAFASSSVWSSGRSEVVRALLWEGDTDAAWEEAVAGGCSVALWIELAAVRAADRPADALPIYVRHAERLIDQKNKRSYEEAVESMRRIAGLLERLGRSAEFPEYLATVRAAHKQKRNLMKLLDEADWATRLTQ